MTGNAKAQGSPVAGIDVLRPRGAHAAAQHVGADEEIALGVEHACRARPACSHQPGLPVIGMRVGGILVAGQRMADEDGVRARGVQRAIGLIGDRERAEIDAAIQRQRLPQHAAGWPGQS